MALDHDRRGHRCPWASSRSSSLAPTPSCARCRGAVGVGAQRVGLPRAFSPRSQTCALARSSAHHRCRHRRRPLEPPDPSESLAGRQKRTTRPEMDVEPLATLFNILANVFLLRHTCRTPSAPVPRVVVGLQILGNRRGDELAPTRDYYLLTTATASLSMQVASIALLMRERRQRHRMTTSGTSPLSPSPDPPP